MAAPILKTYRDLIDHVLVATGCTGDEAEQKRARTAVQSAYRELAQDHLWKYFIRHTRILLHANYSTGSMAYDHTGGAQERYLTLSGGTLPTWARYGTLQISGFTPWFKVAERVDDTHATLEADFNPGADVAAGTGYNLWQTTYPLPGDFAGTEWEIHDEGSNWSAHWVDPDEWLALERHVHAAGRPWRWTVIGSGDLFGSMALLLHGYPNQNLTLDLMYHAMPRPIRFDGYAAYSSQGTARLSAAGSGTATASFTGVSLRTDLANAVLRLSDTGADRPPDGVGGTNQYTEQRIITSRDSATAVTVDNNWTMGMLGAHFAISDPVDYPQYMLGALEVLCEKNMARFSGDGKKIQLLEPLYQVALREAMGRDVLHPSYFNRPTLWRGWMPPGVFYNVSWTS